MDHTGPDRAGLDQPSVVHIGLDGHGLRVFQSDTVEGSCYSLVCDCGFETASYPHDEADPRGSIQAMLDESAAHFRDVLLGAELDHEVLLMPRFPKG